ncbi:hypothetical protein T440DRAFT_477687 [Plenodomus tracheiphilus IPT5]|uniref:Gamma-glutamylcyclotransferase AIG2-like domain-containing protein n=1 Tax=Plenodomus tracheiphilus IPT5 TaxID=1408161 RepID=A0A6A7BBS9_9PLEO|nr:hypothetical protein T440DRAFT_477687 [Plenodomus tracheiphilus IPT5]
MTAIMNPERYSLLYFFCDELTKPEVLQNVLHLPKTPKLRKAIIIGYQRSSCDTESAVILDGMNFGGWATEERVKGVAYEVANEEEERLLHEYEERDCSVGPVDIEVNGAWLGRTTFCGMVYFPGLEEFGVNGERWLTAKGMGSAKRPLLERGTTCANPENVADPEADNGTSLRRMNTAPAKSSPVDN